MTRSNWALVILCFIFWTLACFLYGVQNSYESYLLGRQRERNNIILSHPVVGLDIYKNYCVDGGLNIHEVSKIGGKFISKKIHETRNGENP